MQNRPIVQIDIWALNYLNFVTIIWNEFIVFFDRNLKNLRFKL